MASIDSQARMEKAVSVAGAALLAQQSAIQLSLEQFRQGTSPKSALEVLEALARMVDQNQIRDTELQRAWYEVKSDIDDLPEPARQAVG